MITKLSSQYFLESDLRTLSTSKGVKKECNVDFKGDWDLMLAFNITKLSSQYFLGL